MEETQQLKEQYKRYLAGDCTASELQGILTHFVNMGYESPLMEEITSELNKDVFGETEVIETDRVSTDRVHVIIARTDRALEGIYGTPKFRQVTTLRRMLPYAAAILVFLSFGVWFLYDKTTPVETSKIAEQILPASNRTTLTFNDGRSIELSSAQSSVIVGENTLRYADGTSIHTGADGAQLKEVDELTFSTSKGGTLALTLPDGSSVWLNAESKLSFPAHFSKDVRRVQLEGEAYFDIKSQFADRSDLSTLLSPVSFIVETKQQHIEVLGTQFNVSAYPDDLRRTTTLVEGLVRVKDTRSGHTLMLSPGQQSSLADDMDLVKKTVDVQRYISWKSGLFDFTDQTLEEVMKQLARWYDLHVEYDGEVPEMEFIGKIYRDQPLSQVVKILESAQINCEIQDGRKLIISAIK